MKNKQFILTAEASRILGVVPDTVRDMERRGLLSASRVSGVRLFLKQDVVRLADERAARQSPGTERERLEPGAV